MRRARTQALTLGTGFLAVLLPVIFAFAAPATAQDTLTNSAGNVSLTAPCSESGGSSNCDYTPTSGTPYSSGQQIDISGSPNSALAGATTLEFMECADYEGLSSNLPVNNNGGSYCSGVTSEATSDVNADGSFPAVNYTIYALPDVPTFGQGSTYVPKCGLYPNDCVIFVGESLTNFGEAHTFSAPFQVQANSDDGGEDPGDGTPEVPFAVGLPLLAAAIGGGSLYLRRRRRAHAA